MEGMARRPIGSDARADGRRRGDHRGELVARGLGWLSLGLGLSQLAAPRRLARRLGAGRGRDASAALIGVGVVGVTLANVLASRRLRRADRAVHLARAITVNRPSGEVYRFWRDFRNLARFMAHLESVQVIDERRSRWKAKAIGGVTLEWGSEITDDVPGERIAWRSLEGADVEHTGSVRFERAPGGRGTEIHVEAAYRPPGGAFGAAIVALLGEDPFQQMMMDLRRLKQVIETGEVIRSDASIHPGRHPARPSGVVPGAPEAMEEAAPGAREPSPSPEHRGAMR